MTIITINTTLDHWSVAILWVTVHLIYRHLQFLLVGSAPPAAFRLKQCNFPEVHIYIHILSRGVSLSEKAKTFTITSANFLRICGWECTAPLSLGFIIYHHNHDTRILETLKKKIYGSIKCIPEGPPPGQLRSGIIFLSEIPYPRGEIIV